MSNEFNANASPLDNNNHKSSDGNNQPNLNQAGQNEVNGVGSESHVSNLNYPSSVPNVQRSFSNAHNQETNTDASNQANSVNNNQDISPKDINNKSDLVGTVLTIIVLLVVFSFLGYMYLMSKPKNVFLTSFNSSYKGLLSSFSLLKDTKIRDLSQNNVVTSNTELKFNVNAPEELDLSIDFLNDLNINYVFGQDIKNKQLNFKIKALYDSQDIVDIELYSIENLLYVYMEQLFDKYIKIEDINLTATDNESSTEAFLYLIEKTKSLFIASLNDEYFSQEKEIIVLNEEEINTTETVFILNDKRIKEVLTYIITGLKKDQKSLEAILTVQKNYGFKMSKTELINKLDDELAKYKKNDKIFHGELHFYIYSKGLFNKAVKYELVFKSDEKEDFQDDIRVSYVPFHDNNKNLQEIVIKRGFIARVKLLIEVADNNNIYTLFVYDDDGGETLKLDCNIKKEHNEVTLGKEFNFKTMVILSAVIDGIDYGQMEITADTNVIVGGQLASFDRSNAVDINDLTSEEQAGIMEILMGTFKYLNFFNPSPNPDFNLDWDNDFD